MSLLTTALNLFQKLFAIWSSLSDDQKKMVIDTIVDGFEKTLRYFYRAHQSRQQSK